MKTARGTRARQLLLALFFLKACNLTAYSFRPLLPLRSMQEMSFKGTAPTPPPPPPPQPRCREIGFQEAPESTTRLQALQKMAATISLLPAAGAVAVGAGGGLAFPAEARAAKGAAAGEAGQKEWISGKGAQPKGSDDKTGTRKESKYLRCLSNCLADCQKPTYGPEKDREECLQTCQDECCTSYEQCTYAVTQNK